MSPPYRVAASSFPCRLAGKSSAPAAITLGAPGDGRPPFICPAQLHREHPGTDALHLFVRRDYTGSTRGRTPSIYLSGAITPGAPGDGRPPFICPARLHWWRPGTDALHLFPGGTSSSMSAALRSRARLYDLRRVNTPSLPHRKRARAALEDQLFLTGFTEFTEITVLRINLVSSYSLCFPVRNRPLPSEGILVEFHAG
jgi:hypothetical protein